MSGVNTSLSGEIYGAPGFSTHFSHLGLKCCSSGGLGGQNENHPTTMDFFFIMLKVDLEISPLLERPFCEKLSIFI